MEYNMPTPLQTDSLARQFGNQVAIRRRALKLSQTELADIVGTTQAAIARIEAGASNPTLQTIERLAAALDRSATLRLGIKQ